MARNYWMFVQTEQNFQITKNMNFRLHGLGAKYRRRADRMQPDDNVLYYVSGTKRWTALATIRSKAFEDRSPLWAPTHRGEDFRYRVKMAPRLVLDDDEAIEALMLAPRLEYLKRWAPELWPLAFIDSVHLLPQRDFRLIEAEMKRIDELAKRRRRAANGVAMEHGETGAPYGDDEQDLPVGALVRPAQGSHDPQGGGPEEWEAGDWETEDPAPVDVAPEDLETDEAAS
jgi:hypothetical protein